MNRNVIFSHKGKENFLRLAREYFILSDSSVLDIVDNKIVRIENGKTVKVYSGIVREKGERLQYCFE